MNGPSSSGAFPNGPALVKLGVAFAPVQLIVDTDYCSDAGDAGAMAIVASLAKRGECSVLAVTGCSSNDYTAPALYGQLSFFGMQAVPLGAYKANDQPSTSGFTQAIAARFGRSATDVRANYPDAVKVMRRALVGARAGVVGLSIGPPVNWDLLLNSPADAISPLTGAQLIAAKMSKLVMMGGLFPGGAVEYNFQFAPAAAADICANWPTPIVFVGYGVGLPIVPSYAFNVDNASSPLSYAYSAATRPAWDECTVLVAVRDMRSGINGRVTGTNTVNSSTGANTWSSTGTQHSYVVKTDADAAIAANLQELYAEVSLSRTAPHQLPHNLLSPADSSVSTWTGTALNVAPASSGSPRLGPDWETAGTRIIPTTASTFHYASQTITKAATSNGYIFQVACFTNGYDAYLQLDDNAGNGVTAPFDLTNKASLGGGPFGTGWTLVLGEAFDCGDGWTICRIRVQSNAATSLRMITGLYSGGSNSFAGDITKSVDVWLPQIWF